MKILLALLIPILIEFKNISSKIEEFQDPNHQKNIFIQDAINCIEVKEIHVYFKKNQPSCLMTILSSFSKSSILIKTFDKEIPFIEFKKPASIQVFFVERASDVSIMNVLGLINKKVERKYSLKYFIIFENLIEDGEEEKLLKKMFMEFFRKDILNVVAIFFNEIMNAVTYSPYTAEGFTVVNLNGTVCSEFFYEKLLNLNGHKLKISMIPEKIKTGVDSRGKLIGADAVLAETIVQR